MRMPTFSNSTNILIEASDESNMTRTGFSGHACVGYTPGTCLLYHTSDILESHRHQCISVSYLKHACLTNTLQIHKVSNLKYGILDEPLCRSVKRLSALRPSATTKTNLEAGGASEVAWGVMPWTSGDVK